MQYEHIDLPEEGDPITVNTDHTINASDRPIVPFERVRLGGFSAWMALLALFFGRCGLFRTDSSSESHTKLKVRRRL